MAKRRKTAEEFAAMFQRAYNFNSQRFLDYQELNAFYELSQSELPQYQITKPWVYNINAPYATDAINLRVASLQASDYLGELEPLSPEDADAIQALNFGYKALWNEADTDKHINDAILQGAVVREAYTHVVFENAEVGGTGRKRKGVITPYSIPAGSVNIDPQADCLRNADYVFITERISLEKVKDKYPSFDTTHTTSSMYTPEQRGEIFYGNDFTTEQDNVLTKFTCYEKNSQGCWRTVLVENQIVEQTKKLPIKHYPLAQFRWTKRLKSPYGISLMDMLLPLQKTVNEIESAIANSALQFSSPSYVLSEEAGINPEELALTAGTPGAVYLVGNGTDIDKVIRPLMADRKVDDQLVAIKQEMEATIYKLAGISPEFLGSLGTSGNTSGGTDMAVQRAQVTEQRALVQMEEYVEDLTRIFVDYLIAGFGGETLYAKQNNSYNSKGEFSPINIPEVNNDMEYNFYIKLDVKTKYSKNQQRVLMKELYQQQEQYGTTIKGLTFLDVLKTYDVPQLQELVNRFEQLTSMDASQRAELVMTLVSIGEQYGMDGELVQQAVSEIIANEEKTPTVDMFLQQVEQAKMQEQVAKQAVVQAISENELAAQQPPTGNEVYTMQAGAPASPAPVK